MGSSPQRSQRYLLSLPLRYRSTGQIEWKAGVIINVSGSGLLFEGELPLHPGIGIEVWFALPQVDRRRAGAQVFASGFVVRCEETTQPPQTAARMVNPTLAPAGSPHMG